MDGALTTMMQNDATQGGGLSSLSNQDLINQAYKSIGVAAPDVAGQQYWQQQLSSGALTPQNFGSAFLTAASGVTDPTYAANVAKAQEMLASGTPIFGQPTVTNQQITSTLAANPNWTDAQIAEQMNKYGVSPQQMAAATGVSLPEVQSRYNAAQAQNLQEFPSLVGKAYQDVLGRSGDVAGSQYWQQQLQSGALKPQDLPGALAQAAIPVATTLQDRLALQKYLGKDVYAPASYLQGTGGLGYKDVVNFINANVKDPTAVYLAAQKYGISPEEILQAKQAVGGQDIPTVQAIKDYMAQGKAGYTTQFTDLAKSVFGPTNTNVISKLDPNKYIGKTMEEIRAELQNSPENKAQDAIKLANVARSALGYSDQDAYGLIAKAQSGQLNDTEKQIYDTLLKTNTISGSDYDKLLSYAAINTPNAPIFKANPKLLQLYTPINVQPGTTGQYGYINNAPILNAKFAEDYLKDANKKQLDLGADNDFGWATSSRYQGNISKGPAIFGVDLSQNQLDALKKADNYIKENGGLVTQYIYADDGAKKIPVTGAMVSDTPGGSKYFQSSAEIASKFLGEDSFIPYDATKNKLEKAADNLGLNPAQYSGFTDLYDAVNDKTKDVYSVVGRTSTWDPAAASELGTNHAGVLYKKVNDKLIPITKPQGFNFEDPKTSGLVSDFYHSALDLTSELLKMPPIQAALMVAGGMPGLFNSAAGVAAGAEGSIQALVTNKLAEFGVEKAIQPILTNAIISGGSSGLVTFLATGGDLEKALKSGAMGAIGSAAGMLGSQYLTGADIPFIGKLTDAQAKTIGNLIGGAAVAELAGKDVGEYFKNRAVALGLGAIAKMSGAGENLKITEADKEIFSNVVSIIKSGKVDTNQVIALTNALNKSGYLPKAA